MGKKDKKKQGLGAAKTAAKTAAKAARRAKKAAAAVAASSDHQDHESAIGDSILRPRGRTASCFLNVGDGRLLMIGGERFAGGVRGDSVEYFGGVWEYCVGEGKWVGEVVKDDGGNVGPGRRSAAQAVVFEGGVWLYGGECLGGVGTGGEFMHCEGVVFRLDLKRMKWGKAPFGLGGLKGKGRNRGPGGRSGHRMVVTDGGLLLLFGGYIDVSGGGGSSLKYFDDLWYVDLKNSVGEMEWIKVDIPGPSPRSGFSFASVPGYGVFLYGGYAVGRNKDGGLAVARDVMKEAWKLNVAGRKGKEWGWERLGKSGGKGYGIRSRCGIGMVTFKNDLYAFGGVEDDVRATTESVQGLGIAPKRESKFFSDIFEWSWKKERWYPVAVENTEGYDEEQEGVDDAKNTNEDAEEEGKEDKEGTVAAGSPCGRFNSSTVVVRSKLYVYGGIVEKGNVDIVLDDMWSIDLAKPDGWSELEPLSEGIRTALETNPDDFLSATETENSWETYRTMQQEQDELDELLEELEIGFGEDGQENELENVEDVDNSPESELEKINVRRLRLTENLGSGDGKGEGDEGWDEWTPRVGEDLKEFFARSKEYWTNEVQEEKQGTEKELRAVAFQWAKKRFDDVKPTIRSLELLDSQEKRIHEEKNKADAEKT